MQMPVLQDKHSVVYGQQLYGTLYRTARFHQFQTEKKKKGPALIESHGSSTLCMWTSVRSIFLSSIAVFLSVFPCYVTQFFLRSQPLSLKVSCPLGSPNVFCFPPFSPLLLFVSFIFVIVHVQASLTRWICLKKKKKKRFQLLKPCKTFWIALKIWKMFSECFIFFLL